MSYYHSILTRDAEFDKVIERVTEKLKEQGFGIITEIDMTGTLKKKLDVDFKKYRILGACNPSFAHKALQQEDKVGVMLPCNVVVEEQAPGQVEVSAVDPVASMQAIANESLKPIAEEVRTRLWKAIDAVQVEYAG